MHLLHAYPNATGLLTFPFRAGRKMGKITQNAPGTKWVDEKLHIHLARLDKWVRIGAI